MPEMNAEPSWTVVDFDQVPAIPCSCGQAQRALGELADFPGSLHRVTIDGSARTHYHRHHTETYYVLACEPDARLELDEQWISLKPGLCIVIPPLVRHRAVGRMTILNLVVPPFDPEDEWYDAKSAP